MLFWSTEFTVTSLPSWTDSYQVKPKANCLLHDAWSCSSSRVTTIHLLEGDSGTPLPYRPDSQWCLCCDVRFCFLSQFASNNLLISYFTFSLKWKCDGINVFWIFSLFSYYWKVMCTHTHTYFGLSSFIADHINAIFSNSLLPIWLRSS